MTTAKKFRLEVNPRIPGQLKRLEDLATNLWYSWNRPARELFGPLDPDLWLRSGHNPKVFLRCIDEKRLNEAAEDSVFMANYNRVVSDYDTYLQQAPDTGDQQLMDEGDLVAYFCAEYGFHESFPIYSGGLGILAGHHCKAASDINLPFIAVGFLYRQGYFTQMIDGEGNQIAQYHDTAFNDLPVTMAADDQGAPMRVQVELGDRVVQVQIWLASIGRVTLCLLDTNLDENTEEDREITHVLYGGDRDLRIRQEIILGIGGVRALHTLEYSPTVWHVNEGHAAFLMLERIREGVSQGLECDAALEAVAASTVFTTHTPVPAGHDHFPFDMVTHYFQNFAGELGITDEQLLALGRLTDEDRDFNMTALAVRLSRHQNGVSRIHGDVSSRVCAECWPQVPADENPMGYVTNGVHVASALAKDWSLLFDRFLGADWRARLRDEQFWKRIDEIPDHLFWSVSQSIKSQMLYSLRDTLRHQHLRNQMSEAHLERMFRFIDPANPNVLTVGFARRFATYKRATMLFNDLGWLREIVNNDKRPVVFIFAGKAHPADQPSQDLMRTIHNISNMPEFVGKILLVEGYDLGLARRLVSGVDVWLNTPVYPEEASGTSGMKAAINGTPNLSVLDGWWGEGYDGDNGWAIKPSPHTDDPDRRDREDARTLYEHLQDHVIPLYYDYNKQGYSDGWVKMAKHSITSILPAFNMERVLFDYLNGYYLPGARHGRKLVENNYAGARELALWKARVKAAWSKVKIHRCDKAIKRLQYGENAHIEVAVRLNGLAHQDVIVELILSQDGYDSRWVAGGFTTGETSLRYQHKDEPKPITAFRFEPVGEQNAKGEQRFILDMEPSWCGRLEYQIRAFPFHTMLTHLNETGLMTWL
ncbi:MAG: glycosyltransferase family 1 protein [Gammaproteobacteria bacterium]|nr:MAG: glycosyltransferase family 1 protein [Gammaproteobacteria bacterium]